MLGTDPIYRQKHGTPLPPLPFLALPILRLLCRGTTATDLFCPPGEGSNEGEGNGGELGDSRERSLDTIILTHRIAREGYPDASFRGILVSKHSGSFICQPLCTRGTRRSKLKASARR